MSIIKISDTEFQEIAESVVNYDSKNLLQEKIKLQGRIDEIEILLEKANKVGVAITGETISEAKVIRQEILKQELLKEKITKLENK